MIDVDTPEQARRFLQDVLRYIGAHYGGTLAHHLVALCLQELP